MAGKSAQSLAVPGSRGGIFLAAAVLVAGCDGGSPEATFESLGDSFVLTSLETLYNVDDAGVGDLNADGRLDLWTTNHSALQWIALATSDNRFVSGGVDVLGLHQDGRIPGIEGTAGEPQCPAPKRLFVKGAQIVLDHNGDTTEGTFAGELYLPWPSRVTPSGNAAWAVKACPSEVPCTRGLFQIEAGGDLRVDTIPARSDGFPVRVDIDSGVALDMIGLGRLCLTPDRHDLEFALKDRHGMLLADLASTDEPDLFISRGGARGRLNQVHPGALDELWVWQGQFFSETIAESGITKEGCPGRQVGAMDIDRDGDLDIYQVCGRSAGAKGSSLNRLYIQTGRGRFEERAEDWGLALEGAGTFAWVPRLEPGARPRFVWATGGAVAVFEFDGSRYRERWRGKNPGGSEDPLLVGDIRGNGELAVAIVSRAGSTLLEVGAQTHRLTSFSELGLPDGSIEGDLVDVDGDGSLELFLVPHGLYQRQERGEWQGSGLLALEAGQDIREARSSWFDADSDGDLDLWLTLKDAQLAPRVLRWPPKLLGEGLTPYYTRMVEAVLGPRQWQMYMWQSLLLERKSDRPSHVAIEVVGPPGNRQALGARVEAISGNHLTSVLVGQADGSRLSQTLHRVYLGVRGVERFDFLTVYFPDGAVVTVRDVDVRALPVLAHPNSSGVQVGELSSP